MNVPSWNRFQYHVPVTLLYRHMLSFAVMVLLSTLFSTYRILYTYIFIVIWNTTSSCDPASYCVAGMIVHPGSSGKSDFCEYLSACVYTKHILINQQCMWTIHKNMDRSEYRYVILVPVGVYRSYYTGRSILDEVNFQCSLIHRLRTA